MLDGLAEVNFWQELLSEIEDFLKFSKHVEDYQWLLDLAFPTDLTDLLNELCR